MKRILILGGSTESRDLAQRLAPDPTLTIITSLAGRTAHPATLPGAVRTGGFGGIPGLIDYLKSSEINVVLDATHPFAAQMSAHAEAACRTLNLPLIALSRPSWQPSPGDQWHHVPTTEAAADHLLGSRARIFLTTGRQELAAFAPNRTAWFLIRTIDPPPPPLPPNQHILLAKGPFTYEHELHLLTNHRIDLLVTKNSGGDAAQPKLAAARTLGLPVLIVDQPRKHTVPTVSSVEEAIRALHETLTP